MSKFGQGIPGVGWYCSGYANSAKWGLVAWHLLILTTTLLFVLRFYFISVPDFK
ncbi:hypothetical protein ACT3CD_08935 [Geofilum sp. OHC36d9]|uniref:hypothetical protein n=1 Tax=Geofilum sp. OHC36d9 TaxID=3458413 RepID=UPI0040347423